MNRQAQLFFLSVIVLQVQLQYSTISALVTNIIFFIQAFATLFVSLFFGI